MPAKHKQQQQYHSHLTQNFFDNPTHIVAEQQHPQQQLQLLDVNNMSAQEKYVLFLQQRHNYNKQQQEQQEQQHQQHQQQHQQQLQHQQQQLSKQRQQEEQKQQQQIHTPSHIFFVTTASPVESLDSGVTENHSHLLRQHPSSAPQYERRPSLLHPHSLHAHSHSAQQQQQLNYPQHSPIRHAVYPRPELQVPQNHYSHPLKPTFQQILRTIVNEAGETIVVADRDVVLHNNHNNNKNNKHHPSSQSGSIASTSTNPKGVDDTVQQQFVAQPHRSKPSHHSHPQHFPKSVR